MALTISIAGTGVLTDAESTTNWGTSGSGGISATQETDLVLQGTYAVSCKSSGAKYAWLYWDEYTAGGSTALNFQSGGGQYKEFVYIWFNCTTIGALDTKANAGLAIRIGTDASNYRTWILGGYDDFGNNYTGGWQCAVIDPTKAGSISDTGTYATNDVRWIGMYIQTLGAAKSENLIIDTIAVGSGLSITGTDATGWQEVADYCNDYTNRAWGMFQERNGIFYVYGGLGVGTSTQTENTVFSDSSAVIKFGDYEYWDSGGSAWVTAIPDDASGLAVSDNSSYYSTFQDGVLVGSDSGRSGSVFIGSDNFDCVFYMNTPNNSSSGIKLYGTSIRNMTSTTLTTTISSNASNSAVYGVTFEGCSQVNLSTTPTRNTLFVATSDTDSALLWNESIDIEDCSFIANTIGAGIEHPSAAGTPYSYESLTFSGNTYDVYNSSGSPITVQNAGTPTSNASSYEGIDSSSTVSFETPVTLSIHVEDVDGNDLQHCQIYLHKASPTMYTADSGNSAGDGDLVVNEAIDTDLPSVGWCIIWVKSSNEVIPIRYASYSGSTFTFRTEVTGTADTGGSSTTLKRKTGTGFTSADIEEGDAIRNTTDGSWAVVDEIVDDDTITTTPLQDGSDNTWSEDDGYSFHKLPVNLTDNDDIIDAPIMNMQTDSDGDASKNYNGSATAIVVRIRSNNETTKYIPYNTSGNIGGSGYSLTAVLQEDEVAS